MAVKNSTILSKIWLNGTNDYQQRMPNPVQARISSTVRQLQNPLNGDLYNQFVSGLINLVGEQRVHDQAWRNPLSVFKGSQLMYGSTIEEIGVKWIEGHTYQDDTEDLLKMERPEIEAWFHTLNREMRYPISVVRPELMQAFRDEYGLNRLVNQIMNVPMNSDELDEYETMMQLTAEYEHNFGFFKHHLSAEPTNEATGKEMLTALRTYAFNLRFPTALYNAPQIDIPVFANREEMVLIIRSDAMANIDVNTLAGVFNLDKAEIQYRTIVVPEIPIPNAVAILTTDGFFVCNDVVYQTTSFNDPATLATKYWLHHWEVVSVSPFVPAILFTTDAGTTVPTITQSVSSLTVTAGEATVPTYGGELQLSADLKGTLTADPTDTTVPWERVITVAPDSVLWSVAAQIPAAGDDKPAVPVQLGTRTWVDSFNVLHVEPNLPSGAVLTITAESTYINPSGVTNTYTASTTVTVQDPA